MSHPTPLQAVTRTLERLSVKAEVFESVYDGYSLFAIRDATRYITARVNHVYPYEVIFLIGDEPWKSS